MKIHLLILFILYKGVQIPSKVSKNTIPTKNSEYHKSLFTFCSLFLLSRIFQLRTYEWFFVVFLCRFWLSKFNLSLISSLMHITKRKVVTWNCLLLDKDFLFKDWLVIEILLLLPVILLLVRLLHIYSLPIAL